MLISEHQVVTLNDGRWEGQPTVDGGASRPAVGLAEGFRLTGDLDGDGRDEAAVLLWESSGGSGTFNYVAVMGRRGDHVVKLGTAPIGDRVQVRGGRITDGRIELDVVQQAPGDAACCPSQLATRYWTLDPGLQEGPAATTGTLSIAALGGADWTLTRIDQDLLPDQSTAITLQLDGDKLVGSSGCNRYFGSVKDGATPGEITVGPTAGTRMACPGPAMQLEQRYLSALGAATRFGFVAGTLVLSGNRDGTPHSLVFSPRPAE